MQVPKTETLQPTGDGNLTGIDNTPKEATKVGGKRKNKDIDKDDKDESKQKFKVTRACFLCKKSHAACDNNRPCSRWVLRSSQVSIFKTHDLRRCVSLGRSTACVDAQAKKRGRKPRSQPLPQCHPPHFTPIEKRRKIGEGKSSLNSFSIISA